MSLFHNLSDDGHSKFAKADDTIFLYMKGETKHEQRAFIANKYYWPYCDSCHYCRRCLLLLRKHKLRKNR
ncbi:putative uncharacterized protein [Bacillus altitudinis]|nr:putative uncharacterized protein [Bacillus pumilus]BDC57885.1 hypothetical protein NC3_08450 [Bacillus altitudinis]